MLTTRTAIINYLIQRRGYRRYLEIGVNGPAINFDFIEVAHKEGVDPDPKGPVTHAMTSDDYFAMIDGDGAEPFDLIFVDGLHIDRQVMKDVENALRHLSPRGMIVLHDCCPPFEECQVEEYDGESAWNGTVWKAFARLRMTRDDLWMCVVDADWGVGLLARGRQTPFPAVSDDELNWDLLESERLELLNLVHPVELPGLIGDLAGCAPGEASLDPARLAAGYSRDVTPLDADPAHFALLRVTEELVELHRRLAEAEQEIRSTHARLSDAQQDARTILTRLAGQDDELVATHARLAATINELQAAHRELARIQSSLWWRAGKPLRSMRGGPSRVARP